MRGFGETGSCASLAWSAVKVTQPEQRDQAGPGWDERTREKERIRRAPCWLGGAEGEGEWALLQV